MAKILVVDDNPTNRSYLVTLLGYGGHTIGEALDGSDALAYVFAEHPDLVIADILMPTMDGYEFVRRLRAARDVAHTPVIFCTAHFREREARDLAGECGVSYILTKPCDPEKVIEVVDQCLGAKPAALPPVDQNFDREHLRLLTDKLLEKTQQLSAANLRLQALVDISLQLASESDPSRLLDRFCSGARDLIASSYSLVAIPSEDQRSLVHTSAAGLDGNSREIRFSPDHPILANVMKDRRPKRVWNSSGDPTVLRFPASFRPFQSLLVAPIVSPSRAYGWLCLFHRLGQIEFGGEDERLAGILSALVGRIYENSKTYATERLLSADLKREIAERRKAEEESAQLADIVQSSEDGIIGMTLGGSIVSWNRGAGCIFGYAVEDVIKKPISLLFGPQEAASVEEALRALQERRPVPRYETVGITQTGASVEIAVTLSLIVKTDGSLAGVSAIVRDVTAQKRLQQQLLISQKLEAVGHLSAGIAHDFSNILAVIEGYGSQLLERRTEQNSEYKEIFEINQAAERAARLIRQLLTFSSRQAVQPCVMDLNTVVADMERLLNRVIGEGIELVTALDASLGCTIADLGELEQVIMNLAVNARDSMAAGGRLTIRTERRTLQDALTVRNATVPPGEYVTLAITDTGIGMDVQTLDRMFEPFFTTKGPGTGTGLGLSVVYGIVERSGGVIVVYSEPGRGSTFQIFLPRVEEAATPIQPTQRTEPLALEGSETILVVEDDATVRELLVRVLEGKGYRVLEARNAAEALALGEQHPAKIDLVASDITMPGINGVEFARCLLEIRSDAKVLLMSAYAGTASVDVPFIEKPFTAQSLIRKVREVLDSPAPEATTATAGG